MVYREKLYYKTNKYTYNFQIFQTMSTFGRDIYNGTITKKEPDEDQSEKFREKDNKKKILLKNYIIFVKMEKDFLMLLIAKYFIYKLKAQAFPAILISKY